MALGIPTPEELNSTPDPNAAPAIQPAPQPSSVPAPVASGQSALASPNDIADAAMKLRVSQPAPGSFGAKLAQALDNNPIPLKPNGKPEPGGWARSILGATQNVLANLGDISTEKAPAGAGIFSGFAKAQANNQQRLAQQKAAQAKQAQQDFENQQAQAKLDLDTQKNQLDTTEANMRMQHQQAAAHLAGMDDQIAQGNKTVKMLEDPGSGHPTPIAARDITYGDIQKGVIDGKWNLHDFTAFPTGRKVTGEDANGEPQYTTTYTLLNAQGKVTPNEDEIKYLNDNKVTSQPIVPGQEFTFAQWNSLHQNADDISTATKLRNKSLMDSNLASEEDVRKLEPSILGKNPLWLNAITNAGGDPVKAYNTISKNPAFLKQFPNLAQDMKTDYPEFGKMVELREQEAAKIREKAAVDAADAAANTSAVPMTTDLKAAIQALPEDKRTLLTNIKDNNLQSTLYSLAQNDGTLDLDRIFPNRKYKGSQEMDLETATGILKQLNPNFNDLAYRQMNKAYTSLLPGTPTGKAIIQYNNVLRHAAGLQDTMAELGTNKGPKFWNTSVNKLKTAGVGVDPAQITAAMEPLKSEFELLNSGGYKPDQSMTDAYNTVLNPNSTPNQISGAIKKIAATGAIRLSDMDEDYYAVAGKHAPNLVTPQALAAAEHIGLNTPQGDPQTYSLLQSLASNPRVQFQTGIPNEKPAPIPPTVPKEATHVYRDKSGNVQGYALGGVYHALAPQGAK